MEKEEKFTRQHDVIVVLKKLINTTPGNGERYMKMHLDYYKHLQKDGIVLKYGNVLNDDTICIILNVNSDLEFEQVVINDPAFDKLFEIKTVIPFLNCDLPVIYNETAYLNA